MTAIVEKLERAIEAAHRDGDERRLRALQRSYRLLGVQESRSVDRHGNVLAIRRGLPVDRWRESAAHAGAIAVVPARHTSRRARALYDGTGSTRRSRPIYGARQHTTTATGGPVRRVLLERQALRTIADDGYGFDSLESSFGLYGWLHDDGTLRIGFAADVSLGRERSSVAVDLRRMLAEADRLRHTGAALVGDLHIHPDAAGSVAQPSKADLRWWTKQVGRSGTGWWCGIVMQRLVRDDVSWLRPRATAFLIRDDNGKTTCDVLDVQIEHA